MRNGEVTQDFIERAKKVKLLLMDCDGVLTDGKLYFSATGEELKTFHVHDGQGISIWHKAGFKTGIITGRESEILKRRVSELKINYLIQNSKDKLSDLEKILNDSGYSLEEIAYVGDDVSDLEVLKAVALPIAVGNCVGELKKIVSYITNKHGGCGAVREIIEVVLKQILEN